MQWYDNPAIQSAFMPIVLASVILLALQRYRGWSEAIAVIACFLSTTYLIMGIDLFPLTSSRKIVILTMVCFLLGLVFFIAKPRKNVLLAVTVAGGIASSYWVIWLWLIRQEWLTILMSATACAAFILANSAGLKKASSNRRKFLAIAGIFALSISFCSIIGASAKIGQLAMALAMPFFVASALEWIKPHQGSNLDFLFPLLVIPASLLAISSSLFAVVPWFVLVALSLIPVSSYFSLPSSLDKRYKLVAEIAISAVPGLLAILLTWNSAGPVPL